MKFDSVKPMRSIEACNAVSDHVAVLERREGSSPGVQFSSTVETGADNVADHLCRPNEVTCGGSWRVDPVWVAAGDFDEITRLTSDAIGAVRAA